MPPQRPIRGLLGVPIICRLTAHIYVAHPSGDLAILYLPDNPEVTIRLDRLAAPPRATWIDPRTGARHEAGSLPNTGTRALARPGPGDWVLLLEVGRALARRGLQSPSGPG